MSTLRPNFPGASPFSSTVYLQNPDGTIYTGPILIDMDSVALGMPLMVIGYSCGAPVLGTATPQNRRTR